MLLARNGPERMTRAKRVDEKGPYVLEGSHRISALKRLGAQSFPALVVVGLDDVVERVARRVVDQLING